MKLPRRHRKVHGPLRSKLNMKTVWYSGALTRSGVRKKIKYSTVWKTLTSINRTMLLRTLNSLTARLPPSTARPAPRATSAMILRPHRSRAKWATTVVEALPCVRRASPVTDALKPLLAPLRQGRSVLREHTVTPREPCQSVPPVLTVSEIKKVEWS